jgi:hypothetical protein
MLIREEKKRKDVVVQLPINNKNNTREKAAR